MVDVKPWCISQVGSTRFREAILRLKSLDIGELLDWLIIPVRNRWVAVPHAVTALVSLLHTTYLLWFSIAPNVGLFLNWQHAVTN